MTKPLLAAIGFTVAMAGSAAVAQAPGGGGFVAPQGGGGSSSSRTDGTTADWAMPWQLTPASPASVAQGESTVVAWIDGFGFVRGRQDVLATLQTPLTPKPGPNATVETCRSVVQSAAAPLGAIRVEAASAGPHRPLRGGGYEAPVEMRIMYAGLMTTEVRRAVLTCKVDARGNILDATA